MGVSFPEFLFLGGKAPLTFVMPLTLYSVPHCIELLLADTTHLQCSTRMWWSGHRDLESPSES